MNVTCSANIEKKLGWRVDPHSNATAGFLDLSAEARRDYRTPAIRCSSSHL